MRSPAVPGVCVGDGPCATAQHRLFALDDPVFGLVIVDGGPERMRRRALTLMTTVPADVWAHAPAGERARFVSYVFVPDTESCWIWTGGLEPRGGYGRFRAESGPRAAHRWSFLAHHGATDEPVIRHTCDVRCCVKPFDLIDGTQAQNIADTVRRGAWTSHAATGPRSWPALAYALRDAARAGDTGRVAELLARPEQLELFSD